MPDIIQLANQEAMKAGLAAEDTEYEQLVEHCECPAALAKP